MPEEQDPELLAGFLDEAEESLGTVGRLFVELERDPAVLATVEAIFRPVHSLKGNSAFFGLLTIKRLAHEMETVLDLVRKSRLTADRAVIDVLLAGLDVLIALVGRVRAGGSDDDPVAVEPLSIRLGEQAARAGGAGTADPSSDLRLLEKSIPVGDSVAHAALARLRGALGIAAPAKSGTIRVPPGLTVLLERARSATLSDEDSKELLNSLGRLLETARRPRPRPRPGDPGWRPRLHRRDGLRGRRFRVRHRARQAHDLAQRVEAPGPDPGLPCA